MSSPLPQGAEVLLVATLIVLLVAFVVSLVRSSRQDPKMALLLSLLSNLPRKENHGSGGAGDLEDVEPDCGVGVAGPRSFDFFASRNRLASRPSRQL